MNTLSNGYCVIVPMFNEEANIETCVRRISVAISRADPQGVLLIVNDGSTDSTSEILERLKPEFPHVVVVSHPKNLGYGAALATGIATAHRKGFGYSLFMDSDLTTDPKYIDAFVARMRGDYDVIKASRYSPGGGMSGVPPHRAMISRVGNAIARVLFGLPISDCTNGFRAIKTDLLAQISFRETGFAIIMEELYHLSRSARTFAEVPYILTSRGADQGTSRFVYRPKIFFKYLKYAAMSRFCPPATPCRTPAKEPS